MFAAKRAFEFCPNRDNLLAVKERVETFEAWRARIFAYHDQKPYLDKYFPWYYKFCAGLLTDGDRGKYNDYYYSPKLTFETVAAIASGKKTIRGKAISAAGGTINTPITWNFDRMLASLGKPADAKALTARFTPAKPALDGAEWQACAPVAFERYQAKGSAIPDDATTAVRVLYDHDNLYVAFECREPNTEGLKLKSVGRDGNVYSLDEVELFLNPEQSDRKFLHFMAAPVKDALYDERKGYIEDPLDPRYNLQDISWTVDWTYSYKIDKEKNLWVVEMAVPFKSLGQPTPRPGAVWTGNFARCRRADGGEELSCWVAEEFGNPEVFGEIHFAEAQPR
jgi:hypothetical protein